MDDSLSIAGVGWRFLPQKWELHFFLLPYPVSLWLKKGDKIKCRMVPESSVFLIQGLRHLAMDFQEWSYPKVHKIFIILHKGNMWNILLLLLVAISKPSFPRRPKLFLWHI